MTDLFMNLKKHAGLALKHRRPEPTSQTPANADGAPFVTPPLLPVCCVCGLVRDEISAAPNHISWVPLKIYRRAHKAQAASLLFTHTYCPACLGQARTKMLQFFSSQQHQGHRSESTP